METKRKALGKGLEQLFSNEVINFENFEKNIVESTPNSDITKILLKGIIEGYSDDSIVNKM